MSDTQSDASTSSRKGWFSATHWCVWLFAGAIFYFSDELDRRFNLWLLVLPLIGIPAFVAVTTCVVGLAVNLWKRRWCRLISVVAAPMVVIGSISIACRYHIDPDWLRFQASRGYYTDLARRLPGPSPRYGEWNWGGVGGAATANVFYALVYDETDRPLDRPVERGNEGAIRSARPYGHHFFLVTEVFQ